MESGTFNLLKGIKCLRLTEHHSVQPDHGSEELLVHLTEYPYFTPHNHADIISELTVNDCVCPAQIFNCESESWVTMGTGITCRIGGGRDVVCIRFKGLSNAECVGLPSWVNSKILGKRPLCPPSDVADTVNTSPTKRIRSVTLPNFLPESTSSLSFPFSLMSSPIRNGLDVADDGTSGLQFSDLSLSGSSILDELSPDVGMLAAPSNPIVNPPLNPAPSPQLRPLFPSTYSFKLVLVFALNMLIFASSDGRTVTDALEFFSAKFGIDCRKANYNRIVSKLRHSTLLEYQSYVDSDISWKAFSEIVSRRHCSDVPSSTLWTSRSVTDWTLRVNGGA